MTRVAQLRTSPELPRLDRQHKIALIAARFAAFAAFTSALRVARWAVVASRYALRAATRSAFGGSGSAGGLVGRALIDRSGQVLVERSLHRSAVGGLDLLFWAAVLTTRGRCGGVRAERGSKPMPGTAPVLMRCCRRWNGRAAPQTEAAIIVRALREIMWLPLDRQVAERDFNLRFA